MEGKGGVLFFSAFIIMIACLAMAFLVEAPKTSAQAKTVPMAAQFAVVTERDNALPGAKLIKAQPALIKMVRAQVQKVKLPACDAECDQNGVPLIHSDYVRAAYVKFPPEGTRG